MKLSPIDVEENSSVFDSKISFDPSKLNINNPQKKMFSEEIIQKMKFVAEISNWNIVRNAQCFFSTKKLGVDTCYKLWADVDSEQPENT